MSERGPEKHNESAAGPPAPTTGGRWWWGAGAVRWLQTDLDGGGGRHGVRVPDLPIASDAAAGANESAIEGASSSASFNTLVTPSAGARN